MHFFARKVCILIQILLQFVLNGLFNNKSSLSKVITWYQINNKPSSEPMFLGRCQTIIWTNAGILLIGTLGTNFSEILIEIHTFSLKKMHLKMLLGKWWQFCLGLNVLMNNPYTRLLFIGSMYKRHTHYSHQAYTTQYFPDLSYQLR